MKGSEVVGRVTIDETSIEAAARKAEDYRQNAGATHVRRVANLNE